MKYYTKILLALISESTKAYLEHRWNTIGNVVNSIIALSLMVFFVEVVFSQTTAIYGWSKEEVLFLTGVYQVITMLFSALFFRNIISLPQYIRKGTLDIFLTKPVDAQYLISLRYIRVHHFFSVLPGLALMLYVVNLMNLKVSLMNSLLLLLNLILGSLILYSIIFLFACLAFWLVNFSALAEFYNVLYRPLSVPIDIFGKNISLFFSLIIPLAFIITIPVKIFLGKAGSELTIGTILVALICLIISRKFWNFALKHYTSASS